MHLTYSDKLYNDYVGEKTLNKLANLRLPSDLLMEYYLVALPIFGDGILEIYDARELAQKYYKTKVKDVYVVGVAPSKEEAFDLVQQIVTDVMSATKGTDMKKYFFEYIGELWQGF